MNTRARHVFRLVACVDIWENTQMQNSTAVTAYWRQISQWIDSLQITILRILHMTNRPYALPNKDCMLTAPQSALEINWSKVSTTSSLFSHWLKGWEWFMLLCVRLSRCHPQNRDGSPNKAWAVFQLPYFYLHGALSYTLMKYGTTTH